MVSTPLVVAAFLLLLILQIITLIRVERVNARVLQDNNTNRNVPAHKTSKKEFNPPDRRKDIKQPSKPRSNDQAKVSSVDKSLRDINLRLKNAERDQEKARKRLTENNGKGSGKKGKYNKPKRNNKNRNDNSRNKRNFSKEKRPSDAPTHTKGSSELSPTDNQQKKAAMPDTVLPTPDNGSSKNSESEFGRGNKITVKRRSLNKAPEEKEEKQPHAEAVTVEATQSAPAPEPQTTPQDTATEKEDQKISFGRR